MNNLLRIILIHSVYQVIMIIFMLWGFEDKAYDWVFWLSMGVITIMNFLFGCIKYKNLEEQSSGELATK